ncbi:unnamed protein product [Amoebophrya sp. A120]|nr:unnamed protein product [Amoebophrya sp. A120]|eukprot:GSA120T00014650001.1
MTTHWVSMRCKLPVLRTTEEGSTEQAPRPQQFLGRHDATAHANEGDADTAMAVASGGAETVEVDLVCEKSTEEVDDQVLSSCRLRAYCPETGRDISEHALCDRLRSRRFCADKDHEGTPCAIYDVRMQQMSHYVDGTSPGGYLCLQFYPQQLVLGMPLALADDEITGEECCHDVALDNEEKPVPADVLREKLDGSVSHHSGASSSLCDNRIAAGGKGGFLVIPIRNYDFKLVFPGEGEVDTRDLDLLTGDLWNDEMLKALLDDRTLQLRPGHAHETKHGVFAGVRRAENYGTGLEYLHCDQYFNTGRLKDDRAEKFVTDRPIKVWISQRTLAAAEAEAPFDDEEQQAELRARLQAADRFYRIVELGWPKVFRAIIETGFSPDEVLALNMLKPEDAQNLQSDRVGFQDGVQEIF